MSNLPPSRLLIIRHHTGDHRKRPPQPPDYDDAVQNVGLCHYAAVSMYQPLKTRPLYEDPSSSDVLVSNRRDGHCSAETKQVGVQAWMLSNMEDLCSADQLDNFVCSELVCHNGVSSGPQRLFSHGHPSYSLVFFPGWHNRTPQPMDITPKVQTRRPQVLQCLDYLYGADNLPPATPLKSQLCTLGPHLLRL